MKLHIRNMVCDRCKLVVKSVLEDSGFEVETIELGEVMVKSKLSKEEKKMLDEKLNAFGFELISDKKSRTIDKVKTLIIKLVGQDQGALKINLSDYLSEQLHQDYHGLSKLFSEVEGTTIEKFMINQKIEKVKELLMYDELSLSEIAFKLNYSSVAYLSNQFKKVTGLTPSFFKQLKDKKRRSISDI